VTSQKGKMLPAAVTLQRAGGRNPDPGDERASYFNGLPVSTYYISTL